MGGGQRLGRLLGRALLLRCPNCGGASALRSWFTMRERCPACGFRMDRREEGYFLGSLLFNLIAAEGVFAIGLLLVIAWTWPKPPWTVMRWGGIALMILLPLLFLPFSRTLWLAFDLLFRPSLPGDFDRPADA
jgi:uncharacterized protein (DUF983 family)